MSVGVGLGPQPPGAPIPHLIYIESIIMIQVDAITQPTPLLLEPQRRLQVLNTDIAFHRKDRTKELELQKF